MLSNIIYKDFLGYESGLQRWTDMIYLKNYFQALGCVTWQFHDVIFLFIKWNYKEPSVIKMFWKIKINTQWVLNSVSTICVH